MNQISRAVRAAAVAIALVAVPAAARADNMPDPAAIALPSEAPALAVLRAILADGPSDAAAAVPKLDSLLRRLDQPTPLRGFVQFLRAEALDVLDRRSDARPAAEEAIRLLPGYSGPLIRGMYIEIYSDRPTHAVEYLIRASQIDPDSVRRMPDYEIYNFVERLHGDNGLRHARLLAARLFEIGWTGDSLPLRSHLADTLIEAKVAAGDLAGARKIIPNLVDPTDVHQLLSDHRFRELWPALETWAGPRQARLWALYLPELRERWAVGRDLERGKAYVDSLELAARDAEIVEEFLPMFAGELDPLRDYDLLWIASPVGDALARLGRWDETETMFARALETWPEGSDPNAINLTANRARLRYNRGDVAAAARDLRAVIAESEKSDGIVSVPALRGMHLYLACSLHALGRDSDAFRSIAMVRLGGSAKTVAELHLCFNRHDQARDALIAGLADESERSAVISFLQPEGHGPMLSDQGRAIWQRREALRQDQSLLAALSQYGRILPYAASAGAAAVPAKGSGPRADAIVAGRDEPALSERRVAAAVASPQPAQSSIAGVIQPKM